MADELPATNTPPQTDNPQVAHGILDKTLGELLQNNAQAQQIVMKAMRISPEQLQQLTTSAGNNQMMHMTIRDMFKNGIMQQAAAGKIPVQATEGQAVQVTPEQMQQLMDAMPDGQISPEKYQQITGHELLDGQMAQSVVIKEPEKKSFMQKLKGLF